ncbi:MAG TPA: hypothetical protein VFQ20_07850 [Burkholderiaceae bacterium]|nr:hypothetical protein [Burkholderiaceae bacterium]
MITAAVALAALLSPSIGAAQAQRPASAPGMGMGMGAMHGQRMNGDNTYGWSLMSEAERRAHQAKMVGMKTHEECRSYSDQHHAQMVERAKARGRALPAEPRRDACAPLKR